MRGEQIGEAVSTLADLRSGNLISSTFSGEDNQLSEQKYSQLQKAEIDHTSVSPLALMLNLQSGQVAFIRSHLLMHPKWK